jgi:hypothetical protein
MARPAFAFLPFSLGETRHEQEATLATFAGGELSE